VGLDIGTPRLDSESRPGWRGGDVRLQEFPLMKRAAAYLCALACAASMTAPVIAAGVTIKGEVVDIACATSKGPGGRGDGHSACALACAKKGQPIGVLTDDAVYEVSGDFTANGNAKLLDFVAKSVTITGEVTEREGRKLLNIKSIRVAAK
jgi:hypothetical protein